MRTTIAAAIILLALGCQQVERRTAYEHQSLFIPTGGGSVFVATADVFTVGKLKIVGYPCVEATFNGFNSCTVWLHETPNRRTRVVEYTFLRQCRERAEEMARNLGQKR